MHKSGYDQISMSSDGDGEHRTEQTGLDMDPAWPYESSCDATYH